MQDLNDILNNIWPKVREDHFFPELPAPGFIDGAERVGLEIKGKKISLSRSFVEQMSRSLPHDLIIEGLLDHAISH